MTSPAPPGSVMPTSYATSWGTILRFDYERFICVLRVFALKFHHLGGLFNARQLSKKTQSYLALLSSRSPHGRSQLSEKKLRGCHCRITLIFSGLLNLLRCHCRINLIFSGLLNLLRCHCRINLIFSGLLNLLRCHCRISLIFSGLSGSSILQTRQVCLGKPTKGEIHISREDAPPRAIGQFNNVAFGMLLNI
jgi:hypothetical protein